MLSARDVASILNVSIGWVYSHKRALGGFQLERGGVVRFVENRIEQIRNGEYAIPDAKREMAGNENDKWPHENKVLFHKGGSQEMGSRAKRGGLGKRDFDDPYGLLA